MLEMEVEGQGECLRYMMEVETQKRRLFNTLKTRSPTTNGVEDNQQRLNPHRIRGALVISKLRGKYD